MDEMYYILDQKRQLDVVYHGTREQILKKLNSLDKSILRTYRLSLLVQRGIVLDIKNMQLVVVEDFEQKEGA